MTSSISDMLRWDQVSLNFKVPEFMRTAGIKGTSGFVTAFFFNIASPLSALVFASSQSVMQRVLEPGVKELLTDEDNVPTRIYLYTITFFFSTIVSMSMTISIGLSINFPAAVILSPLMSVTSWAIDFFYRRYTQTP